MPMSRKRNYDFSDLLNKQHTFELTEQDFYTTSDDRYLESYVEDIDGGDNFANYCEDFFELLEEEGYYE